MAYTIVRFLSRCDLFQALQEKQHGLLERLDELNEECEELREKLSIVEEEKENMEEKWEKEKEANKRRINENDKVIIYLFEKKKKVNNNIMKSMRVCFCKSEYAKLMIATSLDKQRA